MFVNSLPVVLFEGSSIHSLAFTLNGRHSLVNGVTLCCVYRYDTDIYIIGGMAVFASRVYDYMALKLGLMLDPRIYVRLTFLSLHAQRNWS